MKKKISICVIAFITAFVTAIAFMPTTAYAETAAKMYEYGAFKDGKTVYCCGETGLYKVKVTSSGKVKSKKRIVKCGLHAYLFSFHKNGKFIYYTQGTEGTTSYVKRVKTNGKENKKLATLEDSMYGFSIDGDKIYYSTYDWDADDEIFMCMNLDGSDKQTTTITPNSKFKRTNKKGYKVVIKYDGKYVKEYLKTPKAKKLLGKKKVY
ncbi:MAG: hypothetical protein IJI74_03870 [Firmicutes bacterium]|nr:hypothetical protein [Bacillota bacterium]